MSIYHLLKKKLYRYRYTNLWNLLLKLILLKYLLKPRNKSMADILKIKGKFFIKGLKNSDSKINKFLVETISIEFNQASVPKPTKRSLVIKPKKILFILRTKRGIAINKSESCTFL